jgi:hypothetical protein
MVIFHVFFYFHHFIYLLQVNVWYFFKIKLLKCCDINVWIIMHIDLLFFWNLNISIMIIWSLLKVVFQINRIMRLKHDFLYEPKH